MEDKFFIATLLFGAKPVFKKVNAVDADEAIEIINDHYDNAEIIGIFSLDELDDIKNLLNQNDTIFFINEVNFNSNEIKYKLHIEKNITEEEVNKKYENLTCSILDGNDMVEMITHVYRWLSVDGMESIPLQRDFLE